MPRKKTKSEPDTIPLFETSEKPVVKKTKKKLKQKTWLLIKGWTRENEIFNLKEIDEDTLLEFENLIKAIKSYKDKDHNWSNNVVDVYDKYPKIKPKVIDKFEAFIPTGIDLCYQDESRMVIQPGSADSIDSITVIRGTEEDII